MDACFIYKNVQKGYQHINVHLATASISQLKPLHQLLYTNNIKTRHILTKRNVFNAFHTCNIAHRTLIMTV